MSSDYEIHLINIHVQFWSLTITNLFWVSHWARHPAQHIVNDVFGVMATRIKPRQSRASCEHTHASCLLLYPGQDIWLWPWPLERSHFWAVIHASLSGDHWPPTVILTTPCAIVSIEGITFVPTSANFTPPLCRQGGEGVEVGGAMDHYPQICFGSTIHSQTHLFEVKAFNMILNTTPINMILTCFL